MNQQVKGYVFAVISAVTYGMIPLFVIPLKKTGFSFDTVLFYRFSASVLMIALFLALRKVNLRIDWKETGWLALLGLLYSGSAEFLFMGYDYMPAGVASTILFLYPVLVALIMSVGFREKISWVVWAAIALALFGVATLHEGGGQRISPLGLLIVFVSALCYALYMVVVNKSRLRHMDGAKVSLYSMVFCALFFLVKIYISGARPALPPANVVPDLVWFALITTVISLIALVYAIKYIGSTPTAILGSMEPLVAVAITVILFHEPFTAHLAAGILLILTAVLLTVTESRIRSFMSGKIFRKRNAPLQR